jgi:hypothetical protein
MMNKKYFFKYSFLSFIIRKKCIQLIGQIVKKKMNNNFEEDNTEENKKRKFENEKESLVDMMIKKKKLNGSFNFLIKQESNENTIEKVKIILDKKFPIKNIKEDLKLEDIVKKYCLRKEKTNNSKDLEAFYIINLAQVAKQFENWKKYLPRVRPYYGKIKFE